mgnify:CR=1 FL=1
MVIRPACAAGDWYPADAEELVAHIAQLLLTFPVADFMPHALLVPHNKLDDSGRVSAAAFRHLSQLSSVIDNVIVIAACEDECSGAILPICEQFSTPLGAITVDRRQCQSLSLLPFVSRCDRSHYYSSRIEVQLPFLQTCLTDFEILPILVGNIHMSDLLLLFNSLPKARNTLLVLSLDIDDPDIKSQEPLEQRLLQGFMQYCQQVRWQILAANSESDNKSDEILKSFIVH